MGRILCIDYGKARCGIAVTDELKIIASALTTVSPKELIYFLKQYFQKESVEKVLVGYPLNLDGTATDATKSVEKFIRNFKSVFPEVTLEPIDEHYSSYFAAQQMHVMDLSKKNRETKGVIDQVAATMMLQEYLK